MRQEVWVSKDGEDILAIESRGRSYVVAMWSENCFIDDDCSFGEIMDREFLVEHFEKIGTLTPSSSSPRYPKRKLR